MSRRYRRYNLPIGTRIASILFLLLGLLAPVVASFAKTGASEGSASSERILFCKPYPWLFGGWVAPPRLPLLADIDEDGYADFLYASPGERFVDVSRNGKGWKPLRGERWLSDLPESIAAMAAGRFGGKGRDLAVLGDKGGLSVALNDGAGRLSSPKTLAVVAPFRMPAWIAAARLDSERAVDHIAVISRDGRVRVFDSRDGSLLLDKRIAPEARLAVVASHRDRPDDLVLLTRRGVAIHRMDRNVSRVASFRAPRGREALAAGDVNADGENDILANGRVFLGPDYRHSVPVPGWESIRRPVLAFLANVLGRGRADLVLQHRGADAYGGTDADCEIYATALPGDADRDGDGLTDEREAAFRSDPLDRDTDRDGLFDGWEANGFAGIDLPGMGASPVHRDIFVMNFPYDGVPIDEMEKRMRDEIVSFFARIPCDNPDGVSGFALHPTTLRLAAPVRDGGGKGWGQIADETFPPEKIGFYHWMGVAGMGGGGQSSQLADAGSTGMGSWIHEFGHQLGLSHSGKWNAWAPTYTSLMNYSYSYAFEGDPKKTHFSTGELASLILNESRLPGKAPFPIDKLRFLGGPPYHFPLKEAGEKATYIDWGWTGRFSDQPVKANITFGYSVNGGERLQPSGKQPFNYNGPYELMTDHQASLVAHRGRLYMATAARGPVDPSAPRPATAALVLQNYQGRRTWSAPVTVAEGVTGDPFLASDGRVLHVFYPTADGVRHRFGRPEQLGEPRLLPDSKGAAVSAVGWKGSVVLFLHHGPDRPILTRIVRGESIGPATDLGVKSDVPPGPAIDTRRGLLLLGIASTVGDQPFRWQLLRLKEDKDSGGFREESREIVGGPRSGWAGNRRPTLIFHPGKEYGPKGRLFWIAAGLARPMTAPTAFYIAQTIEQPDKNGGWLLWRYYDEWTNTRSGIGAAWFDGDIVLATTWASGTAGGDGGVFCAYNGTAISNVDMADFDDVSLMANYGLSRSISTFAIKPPAGVPEFSPQVLSVR